MRRTRPVGREGSRMDHVLFSSDMRACVCVSRAFGREAAADGWPD